MKRFNSLKGKSQIFVFGVIVAILLTSAVGVVSGYESGGGCIAYLDADPDSITADGKSTSIMYFKAWCPGKYRFSAVPSIGTIKLEFPQIVPGRPSYATYTAPTTQELGDYKGVTITFYLKDDKDPNVIIESKTVTISLIPNETEYCKDQCRKRALPSDINKEKLTGEFDYDENGEIKRDSEGNPICDCFCEKGFELRAEGCVACEDICQDMDSRAHYDDKKSKPNKCECYCKGKLLEFVWGRETGKCECVLGAKPKGDECECPKGWKPSVWGDKCVEEEKEVEEKTPIEEERERIASQYQELEKGYLLFSEGTVSKVTGVIPFKSYDKYGHVGIYIGDYEVPAGETYKVRDSAAAPLKIYRKDPETGIYQPMKLELGETIKPGDRIIGAVVEMRASGAVFTTVDGMKSESYRTMGGVEKLKRWPHFDWKTTNPPPTPAEVEKICQFVLKKVDLTEQDKLGYWPGEMGNKRWGKERWDCGSLGIGAYRHADLDPTLEEYEAWYLLPQEIYDNIDVQHLPRSPRDILTTVKSPVNLHLYDGEGRHVGMTPQGIVEKEIPNAYYQPEIEEYPQGILIRNVKDDYQLMIEALDEGSFSLHILDHNVCTPGSITKIEFQEVPITKDTQATLNLGSAGNEYLMSIDENGDSTVDQTLEPTSLGTTPWTPETTQEKIGLTFESNSKPCGSSVQIPLTLNGIEDKIVSSPN